MNRIVVRIHYFKKHASNVLLFQTAVISPLTGLIYFTPDFEPFYNIKSLCNNISIKYSLLSSGFFVFHCKRALR